MNKSRDVEKKQCDFCGFARMGESVIRCDLEVWVVFFLRKRRFSLALDDFLWKIHIKHTASQLRRTSTGVFSPSRSEILYFTRRGWLSRPVRSTCASRRGSTE